MRPASYIATVSCSLLLIVALIVAYNYRADRWGVFATDFESFHTRIFINKLYLKTRFLLQREHDFSCFVFGSSRVVAIDAKRLGENCYNFSHSGGLVVDHLEAVKTMLKAGIPVRDVYIALDDLSYNEDASLTPYQHMRRGYPTNLCDTAGFLRLFLLKPVDITDFALVTGKKAKIPTPRFILNPELDTLRVRNLYQKFYDNPTRTDQRFRRLTGTGEGQIYYGESTLEALTEFQKLSGQHGFNLEVFFLPLHYKTYLTRNYGFYLRLKREAAQVVAFRDFSGLNHYTTDNRYWRETSHFSARVGDRIVDGLLTKAPPEAGMGRLMNAENIDRLERRQTLMDMNYLPVLLRREGLLRLQQRFIQQWRADGLLLPVNFTLTDDPAWVPLDITAGGDVELVRSKPSHSRHATATADLEKGDYFVISYSLDSQNPGRFRLRVSQDEELYGGKFKEYRIPVLAGRNRGVFAGYASVDNPTIRLGLGGGDIRADWQPLIVEKVAFKESARGRAEGYRRGSGQAGSG